MFALEFKITGVGWANIGLTTISGTRHMTISYLGPSLEALVVCATELLLGKPETAVTFDPEGGEHVWSMRSDGARVALRIDSNEEHLLDWDEDEWESLAWSLETSVSLRHFANEIARAMRHLLDAMGEERYNEEAYSQFWRSDFTRLRRLEELLAEKNGKDDSSGPPNARS